MVCDLSPCGLCSVVCDLSPHGLSLLWFVLRGLSPCGLSPYGMWSQSLWSMLLVPVVCGLSLLWFVLRGLSLWSVASVSGLSPCSLSPVLFVPSDRCLSPRVVQS